MKILLLPSMLLFSVVLFSQPHQWAWISGDSTINAYAIYGIKGVASPANKPGARQVNVSWTDAYGNFWLFGGYGFTATGVSGYLTDLWQYNISSREWIWVNGSSQLNDTAVYGIQGIASPINIPGRRYGSVSWTDSAQNLWLFGGFRWDSTNTRISILNDLWKYSIAADEWTWVTGDSAANKPGTYGSVGLPSPLNMPGARYYAEGWTDKLGNLWLFSGSSPGTKFFNDLWKYNPSTNEWVWMKGDSVTNMSSIYGTKGVAAMPNKPGGRYLASSCEDKAGNFWLFGGHGRVGNQSGNLNDLWKYSPLSNEWMWISGDSAINVQNVYGSQGTAATTNKPGSRTLSPLWIKPSGNVWLFGGTDYYATSGGLVQNDLWEYNASTNLWTWISGDTVSLSGGVYGTKDLASPFNKPGARQHCAGWTDASGNMWLFGGYGVPQSGSGLLNDLWKYAAVITLPLHLLTFIAKAEGNTVHLRWTAENEIDFDHYEVERSSIGREFKTIKSIKSSLENGGISQYSYNDNVSGLSSIISGHLYYRLKMINKDGSFTHSKTEHVSFTTNSPVLVYPNPARETINLQFPSLNQFATITITDVASKVVTKGSWSVANGLVTIPLTNLTTGIYLIRASLRGVEYCEKVVIIK